LTRESTRRKLQETSASDYRPLHRLWPVPRLPEEGFRHSARFVLFKLGPTLRTRQQRGNRHDLVTYGSMWPFPEMGAAVASGSTFERSATIRRTVGNFWQSQSEWGSLLWDIGEDWCEACSDVVGVQRESVWRLPVVKTTSC
jgi:hypothetical protein